jgi:cytochrome c-type biogenesis protein CcmH
VLLLASAIAATPAFAQVTGTQTASSPTGSTGSATTSGVARQLPPPAERPKSGAAVEALTADISSDLRCPKCQGLSVADSPAESARNMRLEVRQLVEQGYSRDQIMAYFEGTYGEFVLLAPKPQGLNLLVWLGPAAVVLAGLVVVWQVLRRRPVAEDRDIEAYLERVRREVEP